MEDDKLVMDMEAKLDGLALLLNAGNANKGELWKSWHYLQVYSTWGIRLPFTEASLKLKLNVTNPGEFSFFGLMMEAYKGIHDASEEFIVDIFPKVVKLGNDLKSFAANAANSEGAMFQVIVDLLTVGDEDSLEACIQLITDLQAAATANADEAIQVGKLLANYKKRLVEADDDLVALKKHIDSDDRTNQAALNALAGSEDTPGTIANLRKLLQTKQDEYDHAVTVAATSAAYAWIVPLGLIAAGIVAGVYGSEAVEKLEEIKTAMDNLNAASAELQTAQRFNNVYDLAWQGVDQAHANTGIAIIMTTNVQNAWNGISTTLDGIKDLLMKMTRSGEDQEVILSNSTVIKVYCNRAATKWEELLPALKDLTDDPFIVVDSEESDLGEVVAEIDAAVAQAA